MTSVFYSSSPYVSPARISVSSFASKCTSSPAEYTRDLHHWQPDMKRNTINKT